MFDKYLEELRAQDAGIVKQASDEPASPWPSIDGAMEKEAVGVIRVGRDLWRGVIPSGKDVAKAVGTLAVIGAGAGGVSAAAETSKRKGVPAEDTALAAAKGMAAGGFLMPAHTVGGGLEGGARGLATGSVAGLIAGTALGTTLAVARKDPSLLMAAPTMAMYGAGVGASVGATFGGIGGMFKGLAETGKAGRRIAKQAKVKKAEFEYPIEALEELRAKTAADMPPFLEQDRPKKVKEIYSALKREHPDMPAGMKARIAARGEMKGQGKGKGMPGRLRRNKNKAPCPSGGPGEGRGEGRGAGKHRSLTKEGFLGVGVPIADLGSSGRVKLNLSFPHLVSVDYSLGKDPDGEIVPVVGLGLAGPYVGARIQPKKGIGLKAKEKKAQSVSIPANEYMQLAREARKRVRSSELKGTRSGTMVGSATGAGLGALAGRGISALAKGKGKAFATAAGAGLGFLGGGYVGGPAGFTVGRRSAVTKNREALKGLIEKHRNPDMPKIAGMREVMVNSALGAAAGALGGMAGSAAGSKGEHGTKGDISNHAVRGALAGALVGPAAAQVLGRGAALTGTALGAALTSYGSQKSPGRAYSPFAKTAAVKALRDPRVWGPLTGAAAGAGLGYAMGDDKADKTRSALIGAGVGAGVGGFLGALSKSTSGMVTAEQHEALMAVLRETAPSYRRAQEAAKSGKGIRPKVKLKTPRGQAWG